MASHGSLRHAHFLVGVASTAHFAASAAPPFAADFSADIANCFDLAVMSTKGMSVTATRILVEDLTSKGVTIGVLHDFDKAGFSIVHTLRTDTRRYRFKAKPSVIDLGLRLEDVQPMGFESEPVEYPDKKDPRINLRNSGASEAECDFLVRHKTEGGWIGERVELNAMTSKQFLTWLVGKESRPGDRELRKDALKHARAAQELKTLKTPDPEWESLFYRAQFVAATAALLAGSQRPGRTHQHAPRGFSGLPRKRESECVAI